MQCTSFPDRCTASRTMHGEHLFPGEFPGFHCHMMQRLHSEKMINIAHFQDFSQAAGLIGLAGSFGNSEQK
jgi:hypothetical protein